MISDKTLYGLEISFLAKEYNRKILDEIIEIAKLDSDVYYEVQKLDFTLDFEEFYEKCQELDRKYKKVLCGEE